MLYEVITAGAEEGRPGEGAEDRQEKAAEAHRYQSLPTTVSRTRARRNNFV